MNTNNATVPCGEDCHAPYCICHHPDDCRCGCADDLTTDDYDESPDCCDDPDCDGRADYDAGWGTNEPCPDDCDCPWCDTSEHAPRTVTLKPNPAYL